MVARAWGREIGGLLHNGYRVSVLHNEELWRWMVVIAARDYDRTQYHSTVYLKMDKMLSFML